MDENTAIVYCVVSMVGGFMGLMGYLSRMKHIDRRILEEKKLELMRTYMSTFDNPSPDGLRAYLQSYDLGDGEE